MTPVQPSVRRVGAQLLAATGLGVALPLLSALGDDPAFFAARGSPALDIWLFGLAVVLVPPLVLLALVLLVRAANAEAGAWLHAGLVGALAGLFALWGLERLGVESTVALILLGVLAAAGAGLAVAQARSVGTVLAFLAPLPLVALGLFLAVSPVSELALPADSDVEIAGVRSATPVVVVVFSELPTVSLLDPAGELDEGRFPAFASLARSSTWFRNATTVSATGDEAVPALLTGKRPEPGRLPIFQNHRENLFTLLGADYRLNVQETQTRLCPPELCERRDGREGTGVSGLLGDAGATWGRVVAPPGLESRLPEPDPERSSFADTGVFDAERERGFRDFLRSLRYEPGEEPTLDVIHLRLPQGPWTRFPNGSQSAIPGEAPSRNGEAEALQAWQRHLLQAGYADRLLGQLVERMREVGLWGNALLAVVVDHGIAFRPGAAGGTLTQDTLAEIAFVPFFLKLPGQSTGRVEDRHVTSVDVLPTIAAALSVPVPWETDGASGLVRRRGAGEVRVGGVTAPFGEALGARQAALAARVDRLGSGAWDGELYGPGPSGRLVGRTVGEFGVSAAVEGEAVLSARLAGLLPSLPERSALVPSPIAGTVTGGVRPGDAIAVAVNDVVEAIVTATGEAGAARFSALVPPGAFLRDADNEVRVFLLGGSAGEPTRAEIETRLGG